MNNLFPGFNIDEVMNDLMNSSLADIIGTDFSNTQAALNVIDEDDAFIIELAAPGLKKALFELKIEKQILSVSVDQSSQKDESTDADEVKYRRREYNYSSFKRSIRLPDSVDLEQVNAQYVDGLLKIEIAKKDEAKLRLNKQIEIN